MLKARFPHPVTITPLIFGDLDLSPPEIKALLLPPGFTTYDAVSVDKMEIASEAAVDKLRWNAREKEERGVSQRGGGMMSLRDEREEKTEPTARRL